MASRLVPFRFPEEFLARIDAAASSSGMNRTEFVKAAIESAIEFVVRGEDQPVALRAADLPAALRPVNEPVAHRDVTPRFKKEAK